MKSTSAILIESPDRLIGSQVRIKVIQSNTRIKAVGANSRVKHRILKVELKLGLLANKAWHPVELDLREEVTIS